MGYLIDTCIWIDVERGTIAPADVALHTHDEPVFLSPVTIAELVHGAEMAKNERIRQMRLAAIDRLRQKPLLVIDEVTGEIFGRISAAVRREGRDHRYRVPDLWLASQAIQNRLKLLTRNEKDFADIPGLDFFILP